MLTPANGSELEAAQAEGRPYNELWLHSPDWQAHEVITGRGGDARAAEAIVEPFVQFGPTFKWLIYADVSLAVAPWAAWWPGLGCARLPGCLRRCGLLGRACQSSVDSSALALLVNASPLVLGWAG